MYIKYESVDIEDYEKMLEIALFEGINYDYYYSCCRISFIGNFVDILQPMSEAEYQEFVFTMTMAISEKKPILELNGKWILDFSESFSDEDWEKMFNKAKNVLY